MLVRRAKVSFSGHNMDVDGVVNDALKQLQLLFDFFVIFGVLEQPRVILLVIICALILLYQCLLHADTFSLHAETLEFTRGSHIGRLS